MGKKQYLVDTNILIYYFAGNLPEKEEDKIGSILIDSFNVSIVTRIEFLGWRKHTVEGYLKAEEFLKEANVIYIDEAIAQLAIDLRKMRSIKLPDAVIAATALDGDYILVTRNEDDFKNMAISIYNPFAVDVV